jgi:hypothetical protein
MTRLNGWGRALAAIGAGALVLRLCSAYACMRWPEVACHYWADSAKLCFHREYWTMTGWTTFIFLSSGAVSAALVWLFLAPDEEMVDRRKIAGEVLDDAMGRAKARTPVPSEVEDGFVRRFWRHVSAIVGR